MQAIDKTLNGPGFRNSQEQVVRALLEDHQRRARLNVNSLLKCQIVKTVTIVSCISTVRHPTMTKFEETCCKATRVVQGLKHY